MENMGNINVNQEQLREQWKKQFIECVDFFNKVAEKLEDIYEIIPGKSRKMRSFCLVPKGDSKLVTYYGKPINSLRVATTWNWYAGLNRCHNPKYIQCATRDLPFVKQRPKDHPERASSPIFGNMVGYFDKDCKYHCIFGEKYIHEDKRWEWVENDPDVIADMIRKTYFETTERTDV